jgi:hypothetical protein
MKRHQPWQPRMSGDSLFNPFAPATESSLPIDRDRIEVGDEETEQEEQEAQAGQEQPTQENAEPSEPPEDQKHE